MDVTQRSNIPAALHACASHSVPRIEARAPHTSSATFWRRRRRRLTVQSTMASTIAVEEPSATPSSKPSLLRSIDLPVERTTAALLLRSSVFSLARPPSEEGMVPVRELLVRSRFCGWMRQRHAAASAADCTAMVDLTERAVHASVELSSGAAKAPPRKQDRLHMALRVFCLQPGGFLRCHSQNLGHQLPRGNASVMSLVLSGHAPAD